MKCVLIPRCNRDSLIRLKSGYWILVVLAIGVSGCQNRTKSIVGQCRQSIMIEGASEWFVLRELRHIADERVRQHGADLSSDEYLVTVSINTSGSTNLATVNYFKGFGEMVYFVTFDRSGNILNCTNKIATELNVD